MSTNIAYIKNSQRDEGIDMYRALIMIYILCVIHVGYWLHLIDEPISSLILFEMPVIFFISGASLSVARRSRSFKSMLVGRFRRIVIPYYIYIVLSLLIAAVCSIFAPQIFEINLCLKSIADIISFRLIEGFKIPYFYHTWFVFPYLLIYILFWFEQKICDILNPWLISGALLIVCIVLQYSDNYFIKIVSIYNFFFVVGYLFYKKLSKLKIFIILLMSIISCIICVAINVGGGNELVPMQIHKTNGDIIFLFYGLAILSALSILFSYINIRPNKYLNIWNSKGYTIYLWQNFSFIAVFLIIKYIPFLNNTISAALLILIISTVISFPTYWIENKIQSSITKLKTHVFNLL